MLDEINFWFRQRRNGFSADSSTVPSQFEGDLLNNKELELLNGNAFRFARFNYSFKRFV